MRILLKLSWVEAKLFVREPMTVIFAFAFPLLVLIVLANVFGNEPEGPPSPGEEEIDPWRGVGPTDYYIPAYVGLVIASIALVGIPVQLATYRERGIFRRFRASSMPTFAVFGGQVLVMFGMSVVGAITIYIAGVVLYGTEAPANLPLVLGAFLLSSIAFASIGLFVGAMLPTARAAQSAGIILFFVMMFISGAGPPRDVLGDSMRVFSNTLPLTHVIILLQDPWLGYGWNLRASLVTLGFAIVTFAAGIRLFRWS